MAITLAVVKGSWVEVYDGNRKLCSIPLSNKDDELVGYTSSSVSIKQGSTVYTYNERGNQISSHSV